MAMDEFIATFKQHQQPQWAKFYIDIETLDGEVAIAADGSTTRAHRGCVKSALKRSHLRRTVCANSVNR